MKMLKKSAMLAILLAFVFTAAQAQHRGGHDFDPAKRAEKQTAMMTEKLGLSADQAAKVKDINLRYAEKAKAQFSNKEGADQAQMKQAHKALRSEQNAELTKVLNKDQAAKWEQLKAERKDGKGRGKGKGAGRGDFDPAKRAEMQTARMTEKLGLSADQAAKVKAINLRYAEKAKADHAANAGADKSKMKEAHKAVRAEHDQEIKQVLTKDQAAKWEQLKAEHQDGKGKKGPKGRKGEPREKQLKPQQEDLKKE